MQPSVQLRGRRFEVRSRTLAMEKHWQKRRDDPTHPATVSYATAWSQLRRQVPLPSPQTRSPPYCIPSPPHTVCRHTTERKTREQSKHNGLLISSTRYHVYIARVRVPRSERPVPTAAAAGPNRVVTSQRVHARTCTCSELHPNATLIHVFFFLSAGPRINPHPL